MSQDSVVLSPTLIQQKTKQKNILDIKQLNVWNQNLGDVSILENCDNLEVLSLSVNKIRTLKPFQKLYKLKELYLRNNEIETLSELRYLRNLRDLHVLWLCGNPCAEENNYRLKVIAVLPSVHRLDSQEVTVEERQQARMYESIIDSILGIRSNSHVKSTSSNNSRSKDSGVTSGSRNSDPPSNRNQQRSSWQTEEESNPLSLVNRKMKDDHTYIFDAQENLSYQQLQSTLRQLQEKVSHQDSVIQAQLEKRQQSSSYNNISTVQDNILKATLTLVKELGYSQLLVLEKEIELLKMKHGR